MKNEKQLKIAVEIMLSYNFLLLLGVSHAQTLIVVVLIVVNFFVFLVIAPYPTMRF